MPTRFSDLATFDILSVLEFRGYFFVKLAVYHCFYYALLLSNLTHVKKNNFPIYVREETFVRRKFQKFLLTH